jgi:hypothetical protein
MALIGNLLKKGIRLRESLEQDYTAPFDLQKMELRKLLIQAADTAFGRHYEFKSILAELKKGDVGFMEAFREIPIRNYSEMNADWWHLAREDKSDICWPGKVKYFALSSGTSEASSKYIPVTKEMVKAIQKSSIRQILSFSKYDLPGKFFEKGILILGGSTHLNRRGSYFEGDLSGIQAAQLPFWFQHFYKPGKKISKTRDWDAKLNEITERARDWDIGILVGVPAWIQILMERIIARYKVANIHEIWPNLQMYVHGGVYMEPYKKGFAKLLGKPIHYLETYIASEGFIAFQAFPGNKSMRMVLNNGLFYEFVPFNDAHFDDNGEIRPEAKALTIAEVEEGKDYALVLSSCAGAWRYLIGDVVKFVSKMEAEIIITGRTKHYLSLCGEHLSVDNMNHAIELASEDLNIDVREFTVAGVPHGSLFAHHWFIATEDKVDTQALRDRIDYHLGELNDDYKVERSAALKDVLVDVFPTKVFYDWMESRGKSGGQNKFPRVLKKDVLEDWLKFIESKKK